MVNIRLYIVLFVFSIVSYQGSAQQLVLPSNASTLLRSTAADVTQLLARGGQTFTIANTVLANQPSMILKYDTSIANNQDCRLKIDASGNLLFSAAEDNGLVFGLYQYLHQLGFRFYQPGTIWEQIPALQQPLLKVDTVYSCRFIYKTWFISGGYNKWAMDQAGTWDWDTYAGENGHAYSLYQRRNGMLGANRFNGHRGDIMEGNYLQTLVNNPCYVASFNGSRQANVQSVPDVNNAAAMQVWSNAIFQQYQQYTTIVRNNPSIYPDLIQKLRYQQELVGIEVPDGANWANTQDNQGCSGGTLLSESDQQFKLANFTSTKINQAFPTKRYQVYAYDVHANVPSAAIGINNNLDIQVVPTAFQYESSAKGLLQRWYSKSTHISEYHYLNIPQWTGETPSFYLDDLKQTVQRLKEKNAQGIVWEAGVSKFASLPYLLAANNALLYNQSVDQSLQDFCNNMFDDAAPEVYELMQAWGNKQVVTLQQGIQDNKYKMPYYFQLVKKAESHTTSAVPVVRQRITELKAFMHYMALYYDWTADQRNANQKKTAAASLCRYLAQINALKIVNSYYLIGAIANQYPTNDEFYQMYNAENGTAYQNGLLSTASNDEIAQYFNADYIRLVNTIGKYEFKTVAQIIPELQSKQLIPLEQIQVKINYTNGKNYTQRSEFFVFAPTAGQITIDWSAIFSMSQKGYLNFTFESTESALSVITDLSFDQTKNKGNFSINIPAAGNYKLTITSKYQTTAILNIKTNGNYFYKQDGFLGNAFENYRDNLMSLPGYFYVPAGMDKLYFSLNNSNPGGNGFADAFAINQSFAFRNENNEEVLAKISMASDSALFYIDVPNNLSGQFIRASKMEQYRMTISNTSNYYWYVRVSNCTASSVKALVNKSGQDCRVSLTTLNNQPIQWEIYNQGSWSTFNQKSTVELALNISPLAIINTRAANGCVFRMKLQDIVGYQTGMNVCQGVVEPAPVPALNMGLKVFPNPSTGLFNFSQNNLPLQADELLIYNAEGAQVARFKGVSQINIHHLPAGIYFYRIANAGTFTTGKLVKQ